MRPRRSCTEWTGSRSRASPPPRRAQRKEVVRPWVALYEESWRTGKPVSMEYARHDADGRDAGCSRPPVTSGPGLPGSRDSRTRFSISPSASRRKTTAPKRRRYRTLFDTLLEGFCNIEVIFDADDQPVDYRFLEINPAFEGQTGRRTPEAGSCASWRPSMRPTGLRLRGSRLDRPTRALCERSESAWPLVRRQRLPYRRAREPRRDPVQRYHRAQAGRGGAARKRAQLRTLGDNLPEGAIYRYRLDVDGEPHVDSSAPASNV